MIRVYPNPLVPVDSETMLRACETPGYLHVWCMRHDRSGWLNSMTFLQALRDDAELRRKQEIHEAEESKNAHIQDLMRKHEKVSYIPLTPLQPSSHMFNRPSLPAPSPPARCLINP